MPTPARASSQELLRFERLLKKTGDEHAAMHQAMECLAEMIWQAQRNQGVYDVMVYFECLDRQEV